MVVAVVPTVIYLYVALRRIGYPYELEWLEGGTVEIVRRVADGQSIYVQPSVHYVPYPYTPLYFWLSGGLAHLTGVGFLPLRLVSLLSSLGACAVLWRIVWRETGDPVAGVLASGLFTATFAVSGAWLDIGRVDSLALLLLLVAMYRARWAEGIGGGLVVGTLTFLAFMAKQSDAVAMVPVLLVLMVTRRRVGVAAARTRARRSSSDRPSSSTRTSHGWYGYYVFEELIHQGELSSVWRTYFTKDLRHVVWAIGIGLAALAIGGRRGRGPCSMDWLYWSSAIGGLLLSSLVSRLHSGGGPDVLIPAFAGTALLGGLGYDSLLGVARRPGTRTGAGLLGPACLGGAGRRLHSRRGGSATDRRVALQPGEVHPLIGRSRGGSPPHRVDPSHPGSGHRGRSPVLRHPRRQGVVGSGRGTARHRAGRPEPGVARSARQYRRTAAILAAGDRLQRRPGIRTRAVFGALLPTDVDQGLRLCRMLLSGDRPQDASRASLRPA